MISDDQIEDRVRAALFATAIAIDPPIPPVDQLPAGRGGRRRPTRSRRRFGAIALPAVAAAVAGLVLISAHGSPSSTRLHVRTPLDTGQLPSRTSSGERHHPGGRQVAQSGGPTCQASRLRFAFVKALPGSQNEGSAYFSYTLLSGPACTLSGYPQLQVLIPPLDAIFPTLDLTHGSARGIPDPGPHTVRLTAGTTVYFGFGWHLVNETHKVSGCSLVEGARSVPPGNTEELSSAAHFPKGVCGPKDTITAVATAESFAGATVHP